MPIYIQPDLYALVVTGLLGLIVGSFLNVVVARLPVMQEREWFDECECRGERLG